MKYKSHNTEEGDQEHKITSLRFYLGKPSGERKCLWLANFATRFSAVATKFIPDLSEISGEKSKPIGNNNPLTLIPSP